MIINDKYEFVVMHIPKCAGTTFRLALHQFDDAAHRYYNKAVASHPVFGKLDYPHIPLSVLKDYFAEDFSRLERYRSYAIIRDPFSRFPSSLHERLVQREKAPLIERDAKDVAKEVDVVLNELSRLPTGQPITAPELIHFSRQIDYVSLDNRQVVKHLYPIEEAEHVLGEISEIIDHPIVFDGAKNQRQHYRYKGLETMQSIVTKPIERLLPRRVWKPAFVGIKSAFFAAGVIRKSGDPTADLPNAAEIRAFIAEFYSEDIRMRKEVSARRALKTEDVCAGSKARTTR